MAHFVFYQCVVVGVLLLVANGKACEVCFGTFSGKGYLPAVAGESVGKGDVAVVQSAAGLLFYVCL